jgi:formylglycine-generating enzyme required for sulfatase activity
MKKGLVEPNLVQIPAGSFIMGTSEDQIDRLAKKNKLAKKWKEKGYFSRESPQHTVTLESYFIGKYPVTVEEYTAFVTMGGYLSKKYWTAAGWVWREKAGKVKPDYWEEGIFSGNDRYPVVGVSWYEAWAYCHWLSAETGKVYRLPTEAEWEKAARGKDGWLYPWGDEFDQTRCNTRVTNVGRTEPVGRYSPDGDSPYGCVDMVGNISEWALSQFKPYPYVGRDGRNNEEDETERVLRGGSWFQPALRARTASRGMNDPFFVDNDVGFRCVQVDQLARF